MIEDKATISGPSCQNHTSASATHFQFFSSTKKIFLCSSCSQRASASPSKEKRPLYEIEAFMLEVKASLRAELINEMDKVIDKYYEKVFFSNFSRGFAEDDFINNLKTMIKNSFCEVESDKLFCLRNPIIKKDISWEQLIYKENKISESRTLVNGNNTESRYFTEMPLLHDIEIIDIEKIHGTIYSMIDINREDSFYFFNTESCKLIYRNDSDRKSCNYDDDFVFNEFIPRNFSPNRGSLVLREKDSIFVVYHNGSNIVLYSAEENRIKELDYKESVAKIFPFSENKFIVQIWDKLALYKINTETNKMEEIGLIPYEGLLRVVPLSTPDHALFIFSREILTISVRNKNNFRKLNKIKIKTVSILYDEKTEYILVNRKKLYSVRNMKFKLVKKLKLNGKELLLINNGVLYKQYESQLQLKWTNFTCSKGFSVDIFPKIEHLYGYRDKYNCLNNPNIYFLNLTKIDEKNVRIYLGLSQKKEYTFDEYYHKYYSVWQLEFDLSKMVIKKVNSPTSMSENSLIDYEKDSEVTEINHEIKDLIEDKEESDMVDRINDEREDFSLDKSSDYIEDENLKEIEDKSEEESFDELHIWNNTKKKTKLTSKSESESLDKESDKKSEFKILVPKDILKNSDTTPFDDDYPLDDKGERGRREKDEYDDEW